MSFTLSNSALELLMANGRHIANLLAEKSKSLNPEHADDSLPTVRAEYNCSLNALYFCELHGETDSCDEA